MFFKQLGVIVRKDLLVICRRSFLSTLIRVLIWPVVLIVVLVEIKTWTADHGLHAGCMGQVARLQPSRQSYHGCFLDHLPLSCSVSTEHFQAGSMD